MPTATYAVHGEIAVITLENPPVNTLAHGVRKGIAEGLEKALGDPGVKAIVLTGAGNAFSGGAEIREFNTPVAMATPHLREVIAMLDAATKPVIAAIHRVAMGGGLELALGCHYRIAAPGAQLALPEVKLGILPGAGGTQRLPRAIDVKAALDMMISGNPVASDKAPAGLVDEIAQGDLLQAALAFAGKVIAEKRPLRRLRDEKAKLAGDAAAFFAEARKRVAKESRGYPAPPKIVDCVEAAVNLPAEEGLKFERARYEELVVTTESKAMRHAFFGERAAAKIPDVPEATPVRDIRKVAIIGAGTMGGGIGMAFANAGFPVTLVEVKQDALDRGLDTIRKNYAATVSKGRLAQDEMDKRMARFSTALDYGAIRDADLVIEAVFEDIGVKEAVFRKLGDTIKPGAILASNTSTLDLDRIASFTKRPGDVIGMHFFSPANVMRLLEVVRGESHGERRARHGDAALEEDPQARGRLRCLRRLHRQPDARGVPPAGLLPGRGRRAAAAGRQGAAGLGPRDGPVRDDGHGRPGHRLAHPQAPPGGGSRTSGVPGVARPDLRARALRPEDR